MTVKGIVSDFQTLLNVHFHTFSNNQLSPFIIIRSDHGNQVCEIKVKEETLIEWKDYKMPQEDASVSDDTIIKLTVKELEVIYTLEEQKYFNNLVDTFYSKWKSINIGEQGVYRFISFSKNPGPLPCGYFLFKSKIFR